MMIKKKYIETIKDLLSFVRGKIPVIRCVYWYLNNKNGKESLYEKFMKRINKKKKKKDKIRVKKANVGGRTKEMGEECLDLIKLT